MSPPQRSACSAVRRPVSSAPDPLTSSINCPDGPDGRKNSPSGVTYHSCSRSKPSPPGLPGSSFGPAMYPSRDIEKLSTDADTTSPFWLVVFIRISPPRRETHFSVVSFVVSVPFSLDLPSFGRTGPHR